MTILSKNLHTNQSLSLTERSRVSVGILRQHFCEPFLRGGVSATFLPNDAAAAACRRRRRRSSSSSCVGGDARVPQWCSRRVRGPPPAGSCSAAPLGTLMHILYQPFQLNPTCIGTACADPSNITFSDRTPGCFGWNSSPSQCCASRSVHVHHISAIDILYQPITLKSKVQKLQYTQ